MYYLLLNVIGYNVFQKKPAYFFTVITGGIAKYCQAVSAFSFVK
jgi:hypothetical protein